MHILQLHIVELSCIDQRQTLAHFCSTFSIHHIGPIMSSTQRYTHIYTHLFAYSHFFLSFSFLIHAVYNMQYINKNFNIYLWFVSLPRMQSPDWSIGEGSRLRQEARDWLESSLDTVHTHTIFTSMPFLISVHTYIYTHIYRTWPHAYILFLRYAISLDDQSGY